MNYMKFADGSNNNNISTISSNNNLSSSNINNMSICSNNNNNNNTLVLDPNANVINSKMVDESFSKLSSAELEPLLAGAASLALQSSFASVQNSSLLSSLEINVHPAFDNANTYSSGAASSAYIEPESRYLMHSTKISSGDSFDSFETSSHCQKSFENSHSSSNHDEKENVCSGERKC